MLNKIFKKLRKTVSSIDKKGNTKGKMTMLHLVASRGDLNAVKQLVERGGYCVNQKDVNGRTPIFYAAVTNHIKVVNYLIGKGADLRAKDNQGRAPSHYIKLSSHPLQQQKLTKL